MNCHLVRTPQRPSISAEEVYAGAGNVVMSTAEDRWLFAVLVQYIVKMIKNDEGGVHHDSKIGFY